MLVPWLASSVQTTKCALLDSDNHYVLFASKGNYLAIVSCRLFSGFKLHWEISYDGSIGGYDVFITTNYELTKIEENQILFFSQAFLYFHKGIRVRSTEVTPGNIG